MDGYETTLSNKQCDHIINYIIYNIMNNIMNKTP